MVELSALDSSSLLERVVLLAITDATVTDDTPLTSPIIRDRCEPLLERIDAEILSEPAEPEIMRALSVLGTEPYVHEDQSNTSPTGKGRPAYSLATEPAVVLDELRADQRLADAVEFVASR